MRTGLRVSDVFISLPALRAEGDRHVMCRERPQARFLSTPSARRATRQPVLLRRRGAIFLSTPSARRATVVNVFTELPIYDFYPRPPRGGRPFRLQLLRWKPCYFYPRPPRGGRHAAKTPFDTAGLVFLSTPSARRATPWPATAHQRGRISIHALREEGDHARTRVPCGSTNFYPRPPRGGRQSIKGED